MSSLIVKIIYSSVCYIKRYVSPILLRKLILNIFSTLSSSSLDGIKKAIFDGGKIIIDDAIEQCFLSKHIDTSSNLHIILSCFSNMLI